MVNSGKVSNGEDGSQLAQDVEYLCGTLEAIFLHELKNSKVRDLFVSGNEFHVAYFELPLTQLFAAVVLTKLK